MLPNQFQLIPRATIESVWPALRKLFAPAVAMGDGEVLVDDILERVLDNRMFVFADDAFAVAVEFIYYPRKTVMVIGFGAGRIRDKKLVAETLRRSATALGAHSVRTYCKNPAMIRYFRRWFGLTPLYTVLEVSL